MINTHDLDALKVLLKDATQKPDQIHPEHVEAIHEFAKNNEGLSLGDLSDLLMYLHDERRRLASLGPSHAKQTKWILTMIEFFDSLYSHARHVERKQFIVLNATASGD